jgi:hypothetical protein
MASNKDQYSEKDFVQVVDAAGNVQPDAVPKSWIGTDLLPEGYKQATKKQLDGADADGSDDGASQGA